MTVDFAEGESIWTENSHKFTREHAASAPGIVGHGDGGVVHG